MEILNYMINKFDHLICYLLYLGISFTLKANLIYIFLQKIFSFWSIQVFLLKVFFCFFCFVLKLYIQFWNVAVINIQIL